MKLLAYIVGFVAVLSVAYAQDEVYTAGVRLVPVVGNVRGDFGHGNFRLELDFNAKENDQDNVAFGKFKDDILSTGMGKLEIKTNPSFDDEQQAYAAGLIEGAITSKRIHQMWLNFLATDFEKKMPSLDSDLIRYMHRQLSWMDAKAKENSSGSPYWNQVRLVLKQMDGVVSGYNMKCGKDETLSRTQILMLNAYGDLEDLEIAFPQPKPDVFGAERVESEVPKDCSAAIRCLPDSSECWVAHNTWTNFTSMLRIFKTYHLNFKDVKARSVSFSSKPGMLSSKDDFYVMRDTKLVSIETTNGVEDHSLLENLSSETLPCWVRVQLANRLADNGKAWTQIFAENNSGTYNNQFQVADMKVLKKGEHVADNFLWIIEQMPGYTESADVSSTVREKGFWPSFNVPYFKTIYDRSGFPEAAKKRGDLMIYDKSPRYRIFSREAPRVKDLAGMKRMMRLNEWETDELSHNNPTWAIASRYDLLPKDDRRHMPFGAVDAKIVSFSSLMNDAAVNLVSGPTSQNQPPFEWKGEWADFTHEGHPITWDFDWQVVTPEMQ